MTQDLIKSLEEKRKSRIISYLTRDGVGLSAKISMDIIPIFQKMLSEIGKSSKIELFLYSSGGDTLVPYRLVSLIREYCDEFNVIIPYKAYSAATMIALGADQIYMTKLSELTPIDPTITFNQPQSSNQFQEDVSVEDVLSYLKFVKEKVGITDQGEMAQAFIQLVNNIKPLQIGRINRVHNLIKKLAKNLLSLRNKKVDDIAIERIISQLIDDSFAHEYLIPKNEAKDKLGLNNICEIQEDDVIALWNEYSEKMRIGEVFDPEGMLGEKKEETLNYEIAFIETKDTSYSFKQSITFKKTDVQQVVPLQLPTGQVVQQQVSKPQIEIKQKIGGWTKNVNTESKKHVA